MEQDSVLQMTANALVFMHNSTSCEVVNIVEDRRSEEFSESYRYEIECQLYTFFTRNVHAIWGVMDSLENCKIAWEWYCSYLTSPSRPLPMIAIVYGQLALAAHWKGDEIWEKHYSRLTRDEIPPGYVGFEAFIALSLLVGTFLNSPFQMLMLC